MPAQYTHCNICGIRSQAYTVCNPPTNYICNHCRYVMALKYVNINYAITGRVSSKNTLDPPKESTEMAKATLEYIELNTNGNNNSGISGAYKLKLEGHFKRHIEPMVQFIKATIPGSDRTYDPNTYEWFFHEKYFDVMKTALQGSHFTVDISITKEVYEDFRRKQQEYAQQAGQTLSSQQHSTNDDLKIFIDLMANAGLKWQKDPSEWNREIAEKAYKRTIRFYHPDLHPEKAAEAATLNEVWLRLKQSYYIK